MFKKLFLVSAIAFSSLTATQETKAHCQIPCGIFDDANVVSDLHTHYVTIAKSAKKIAAGDLSTHDTSRWIMNKENHCDHIIKTVTDYFLAQRLKLAEMESNKEAYMDKLVLCHKTIVAAMKCKQTTDSAAMKTLHDLVDAFGPAFAPAVKK